MARKKILVLRFSSIGDIVLTTPVPRALKVQLDAEVHYATKPQYAPLLTENPYIDQVHTLSGSLTELIRRLRQERYDAIVDLHHNLRTTLIIARLGVKSYRFDKINLAKWLMVNFKIDRLPNMHIVDRYLATLEPLGVKPDTLGLDYFIPEKDEVERDWLPETHRAGYVAYAIGAQHHTKKLPVDRMIELCDRINKPIVLLGDKNDFDTGEQVARFFARGGEESADREPALLELNKKTVIYNACGKFNLNQSASLVRQADCVFTHDTGLMHIAAAFKKRVYSIWGNTIPRFGMYPYRTRFTVLENNRLRCRPCSKIGYAKCPQGHFKCMRDIVFDFYLP